MSDSKLKTAVMGLDDNDQLLLKTASETGHFDIQAVADKDTKLAEKVAAEYKCAHYDDYRQLIIQNDLDCLLVASAIYSCLEHIRTAMKKKFNILKLAPPARDFEEAAGLVHMAEDENIKFAVANPSRFAQSFLTFREFLQQGRIEQIYLINAVCNVGNQQNPAWQTDPKLAGGGVLLQNCYEIIDQITWNFATPEQIYSLNTSAAGDKQQRLYLTEDNAVVTMKFSDTTFGNLTASRTFGPKQQSLMLYGKDKILTVDDGRFIISNHLGEVQMQYEYDDDRPARMGKVLESFALSILLPDKNKLCSSGSENLKNMAVIESAYLSARTGFPEEPGKILQLAPQHAAKPVNTRPEHNK